MALIEKIKDWYVFNKERMNDIRILMRYGSLVKKLHKLEQKGIAEGHWNLNLCKKYSRIYDETQSLVDLYLPAMKRESDRIKAKYA